MLSVVFYRKVSRLFFVLCKLEHGLHGLTRITFVCLKKFCYVCGIKTSAILFLSKLFAVYLFLSTW